MRPVCGPHAIFTYPLVLFLREIRVLSNLCNDL